MDKDKQKILLFILLYTVISMILILYVLYFSIITQLKNFSSTQIPISDKNLLNSIKLDKNEQLNNKYIKGIASWYDYDLPEYPNWSKKHATAASRRFKRYSTVSVTNIDTGVVIDVFINDYGPEEWTGREIDLSSYAFAKLAPLKKGLINVKIQEVAQTGTH